MRMTNRLAGVAARIKDNAVTRLGNALSDRDFVSLRGDLRKQSLRGACQARQVRIVRFGNNEHVNRSLRIDVAKCERAF